MNDKLPTMAEKVFARFGGVPNLARALKAVNRPRDITAIYRWNSSRKAGGCGGLIPSSAITDVLAAAKHEGIILTDKDLSPTR